MKVCSASCAVALVAALVLAACSPPAVEEEGAGGANVERAQVPDEGFLEAAGFNDGVVLTIPLDLPLLRGEARYDEVERRMLFLWRQGDIALTPDADAAPWVRLIPVRGMAGEGTYQSPPIGRRVITGRSEQRRWEELGQNYFAETISYVVNFDARIRDMPETRIGPFNLRIVAIDDPRAGAWSLVSSEYDVEQRVITDLVDSGAQSFDAFQTARAAEIERAYAMIEQRLAEQGVIARAATPHVLVSRNAGLAFYLGLGQSPDIAQTPLRALPQQAASLCAGVPAAAGHGAWRLPLLSEMDAVTEPHRIATGTRVLLDTPDARLWGQFATVQYPNSLIVPSSEPPAYPAYPASAFFFTHDRAVRATRGGDLSLNSRNRPAVICVASTAGR